MAVERKLDEALYRTICENCGDKVEWDMSPDPDSPRYFGTCACGAHHMLKVTQVSYDWEPPRV